MEDIFMKKTTTFILATAFAISTSNVTFAADNSIYSDVPTDNWAYGAVTKLEHDGIITGFPDNTFKGNATVTRYQMAQIVANALTKQENANAEDKALIEKLAKEYEAELSNIGVRVTNLEKKASPVKLNLYARERFEFNRNAPSSVNNNDQFYRYRLLMTTNLDDNFKFIGRYGNDDNSNSAYTGSNQSSPTLQQAYASGNIGQVTLNLGRQPLFFGKGLAMDTSTGWDGINLKSNKGKFFAQAGVVQRGFSSTTTTYGAPAYVISATGAGTSATEAVAGTRTFEFVDAGYRFNDKLDVTASYFKDQGVRADASAANKNYAQSVYNTYTVGSTYKFNDTLAATGEYGENSNNNTLKNAKAAYLKLKYRGADFTKVGSWGTWIQYRKAQKGFDPLSLTTLDSASKMFLASPIDNVKGFEVGVEYSPVLNTIASLKYWDLKSNDSQDIRHQALLAQFEFKM